MPERPETLADAQAIARTIQGARAGVPSLKLPEYADLADLLAAYVLRLRDEPPDIVPHRHHLGGGRYTDPAEPVASYVSRGDWTDRPPRSRQAVPRGITVHHNPVSSSPGPQSGPTGSILERSTCYHCAEPIVLLAVAGGVPIWNHDDRGRRRAVCSEEAWLRSGGTREAYLAAGGYFATPDLRPITDPDEEPSDEFADGYSAGRYGTPGQDPDELEPAEAAEWHRGYALGLDHGARDERFGDYGPSGAPR